MLSILLFYYFQISGYNFRSKAAYLSVMIRRIILAMKKVVSPLKSYCCHSLRGRVGLELINTIHIFINIAPTGKEGGSRVGLKLTKTLSCYSSVC